MFMAKKHKQAKDSKQKSFADQYDDEEVLFVFRKHPVVMRKGFVFAMLGLLAGTIPALIKPELSYFYGGLAAGFVLMIVIFLPSWIAWYYSVFIVTDQRLIQITRKGLFHKTVVDMSLSQIQSMNYQVNGLQATLLRFGTIMIQTYMGDLVIHDVEHPEKVQKKLAEILKSQGITPQAYQGDEGEDDNSEEDD